MLVSLETVSWEKSLHEEVKVPGSLSSFTVGKTELEFSLEVEKKFREYTTTTIASMKFRTEEAMKAL